MDDLNIYMDAAACRTRAGIVLKNAWIVDVFNQDIYRGDVGITRDTIVGTGNYDGDTEIDCSGLYVAPGFIDAHVHVESSKVIPEVFSRVVIKNGVTTCIADPHEIANVLGTEGIRFMLQNSRKSVVDIFYMMPSCVPATSFEDNGAILGSRELEPFIDESGVLGLGEVMDVPSVVNLSEDMREKLKLFKGRPIDGHCPDIGWKWLNAYVLSGIGTDHECTTPQQAVEEIKRGMYVMLREGSAAKNIEDILPAVRDSNYHNFLFCTDDKDVTDLIREGSIDHNIRKAVALGLNPVRAITMATINAARCYNLHKRGAVVPGFKADLVILEDIKNIDIKWVMKDGRFYEEKPYLKPDVNLKTSMNMNHISPDMLWINAVHGMANVIKVEKGSIVTEMVKRETIVNNGIVEAIEGDNVLKAAVFERHRMTGKYALGFIEGLGIKGCSVAQTIAHDSHNIIAAGDNDEDMALAVNRVIDMGGGIAVASSGRLLGEVDLPVAGLMSYEEPLNMLEKLGGINDILRHFSISENRDILLTLSFMALPVIPELKITARGLYKFSEGRFIGLFSS